MTVVDEEAIRQEVYARKVHVDVMEDWYTPSGKLRSFPMMEATIRNDYLNVSKVVKGKSEYEISEKAENQLRTWAEQEVRKRLSTAKEDAKTEADARTAAALAELESVRSILTATLSVDDKIDWQKLLPSTKFPKFKRSEEPPARPVEPPASFLHKILPFLEKRRVARWEMTQRQFERDYAVWQEEMNAEELEHTRRKKAFDEEREQERATLMSFKARFEAAEPKAIEEYVNWVFERSSYPENFYREYQVAFDPPSKTVIVDVSLPPQSDIPRVTHVKYEVKTNSFSETDMKPKEHDALYDSAIKQCVLRTIHEVFESVYIPAVRAVVVNGWVTALDKATGNDVTSCIISVAADREQFEKLNLERVDPTECIRALKGVYAGTLSGIAPVQPIMKLSREDSRFIESQDVIDRYGEESNLAEMPWDEFEHLVRELFGKMFSTDGAEVRVTQASSDGGVDAIAFDPDPIRGGKFVIQAKRYTNIVGVSAVRDLYGTMISEGAAKGILVTTAHYGRDSRKFAQDKPITLIDGANLVYLFEQHGRRVRIDAKAAKQKRLEPVQTGD